MEKGYCGFPSPNNTHPILINYDQCPLTSVFAKIAEGFVTGWVLDDVESKIDKRQFGNVKGVSTAHYLVSLVHYLHQGADKSHNVGTVVLTDFSKAFDIVDHTILIEKMIHMAVGPSFFGCVTSSIIASSV